MKKFTLLFVAVLCAGVSFATNYQKVTSEPADWSGEYLLVYEESNTSALVWTCEDANSCYSKETISQGVITITGAANTITIASSGNGWSILLNTGTKKGNYIEGKTDKNGIANGFTFTTSATATTLSYNAAGYVVITSPQGSIMSYNSSKNNWRFRYFKPTTVGDFSGNYKPVQLYKKVASENIPATAITLSETSLEIEQYKQATLTATLEPANATTEIVWTSSDEKIVIVDNGQLNAVGVGSATITASAGEGISATCEVTVKSVPALTCEQAAEIALAVSDNNVVAEGGPYVIRGYVTALAPTKTNNDIAKDLTQYGNYSFWMADSKGEEKVFEAYQVAPVDGQYLAAVGDYVEIVGNLTKYNTTPETTGRGTSTVKKLADPTTGVDNATVEQKSVKMIENGQLVIIREGVKYNAQGAVIE